MTKKIHDFHNFSNSGLELYMRISECICNRIMVKKKYWFFDPFTGEAPLNALGRRVWWRELGNSARGMWALEYRGIDWNVKKSSRRKIEALSGEKKIETDSTAVIREKLSSFSLFPLFSDFIGVSWLRFSRRWWKNSLSFNAKNSFNPRARLRCWTQSFRLSLGCIVVYTYVQAFVADGI